MATLSPSSTLQGEIATDTDVLSQTLRLQREDIFSCFRLDVDTDEAERLWSEVVTHGEKLGALQGREVDLRTAAFDYFLEKGLLEDPVVVEKQGHQEAEGLAYRDRLTNLHNYAYFDNELRLEFARAMRYGTSLCLILADLDNFKEVNDSRGHALGNEMLSVAAELLGKGLREGDLVARLGGDEFALLLHEADLMTGVDIASGKCQAVHHALKDRFTDCPPVTVSLGVAVISVGMPSPRSFFDAADRALYHAKNEGRNRCAFLYRDRLICLSASKIGARRGHLSSERFEGGLRSRPAVAGAESSADAPTRLIR